MTRADVTVALSTMSHRMPELASLPSHDGVRWLVLVQGGPVAFQARADMAVHQLNTSGLSHSRNAAISLCATPYLVFADDDHDLNLDAIHRLAGRLEQRPDLCFIAGVRSDRRDRPRLQRKHTLTRWNCGRLSAPEIMVRPLDVERLGVEFDESFGMGSDFEIGEDYIFICDLLRLGARGIGLPIEVGAHRGISSGQIWSEQANLAARIAVLARVFGPIAGIARYAYAIKNRHQFGSMTQALRFAWGRI